MKKTAAVLMALIMLFLTACSTQPTETPETASDSPAVPQTTAVEYITSWGTDLVPDGFPAPPATMSMYSYSLSDHEPIFYPDGAEVLTLTFNCNKPDFITFSNALKEAGYKGGFAHINNGEYYGNGFIGGWQNGEKAIIINGTVELDSLNYTYMLEISDCYKNFPSGLKGIFPEFKGCTINSGTYNYKNSQGEYVIDDVPRDFSGKTWLLKYSAEDYNYFIAVTEEDFKAYCKAFSEMGFSGELAFSSLDGTNVITYDGTKETDGKFLAVSMLYNSSMQTLEILFTNDKTLF